MQSSYAITWREATGAQYSGILELKTGYLRLEGGNSTNGGARHVPYSELEAIGMARQDSERIDGRQTLLIERRNGGILRIAAIGAPGALAEVAEQLAAATRAAVDNEGAC